MARIGRPPAENPKKNVVVRMEQSMIAQLEDLSRLTDMTVSCLVRLAVEEYLRKHSGAIRNPAGG